MPLVTPRQRPSFDSTTTMLAPQISGLVTGEAILADSPCYISSIDNKVYMSATGRQGGAFDGFVVQARIAGEPTVLFGVGTRMGYAAAGLTPGQNLYISATPGRLDTTAAGAPVARAINATDIRCIRSADV